MLLYRDFPRDSPDVIIVSQVELIPLMHHGACVVAFINQYAHTMMQQKFVTDCWNVVRGLLVTVYELVLWLSTIL